MNGATPNWYNEYFFQYNYTGNNDGCNAGDTLSFAQAMCTPTAVKNIGQPESCGMVAGNPINIGTGNKYQLESDYLGAGNFALVFQRTYNSDPSAVGIGFGASSGWRHSYERSISNISSSKVVAYRNDGKAYNFNLTGSVWQPDADVNLKLSGSTSSGWQLTQEDGSLETYNGNGQLLSIKSLSGATHTLTYTNGLLTAVTHSNGRALTLSYDSSNRLSNLLDPAGSKYSYSYDAYGNLVKVTYPDQFSRVYVYNETANVAVSLPHALTGLIDENGNRYATWQYDAQGRAIVSQHNVGAQAVEKVAVSYGTNSSTVIDALGSSRTTNLTDVQGVIKNAGSTQPAGTGCSAAASNITYDANGNTASRTDFNGNLSCYLYDQTRNLELYRLEGMAPGSSCPANLAAFTPVANQRLIGTTWNPNYRFPTQINEAGRQTNFAYYANGTLQTQTVKDTTLNTSRSWNFTYDSNTGQIKTVDGPRTDVTDVTSYSYYTTASANNAVGDLSTVANALGHVTTFTQYDAHGHPLSLTDPNGLTISFAYDPRGRLTSKSVGGNTTQYSYDQSGNLIKVTQPTSVAITYSYDAAHRLTDITDGLGGRLHYNLDAMGNRTQETVYNAAGAVVKTHSRVFDALSRLYQDIGAYNQTVSYQYDANGNITKITNANNNVTQRGYDTLNRLVSSQDALSDLTSYQYDALDRLTKVTDAVNHSTIYGYNGLGDLLSLNSPNTDTTLYSYDSAGNLQQKTDANNNVGTYNYDALNRLTAINYAGGNTTANVFNSYDGAPNGAAHQLGRLTATQRGGQSYGYSYDLFGNLTAATGLALPHPGYGSTISYSYNTANQLTGVAFSTYRNLQYQYDVTGHVNQITVQDIDSNAAFSSHGYNVTRTLASNIARLPFGPVTSLTYGNGLNLNRGFDLDYHLTGQTVGMLQNLAYSYDPAGNLHTATDQITAANSQSFNYDPTNRLLSATGPNSYTYTYDALGNRTTDYKNSAETLYNYNLGNQQLLSQSGARPDTLITDPTGNITQSEGKTYGYAPDQRLASATTAQGTSTLGVYNYDSQGRRIAKTTGAGTTYFDYDIQGQLLNEYGPSLAADYVYLDGQPLARVDYNLGDITGNVAAWNVAYYHNNQVGAPIVSTNPSGSVSWQGQYDPFGNVLPINPSITQNLRFPGQYYDAETGLIYNNQRYYDQLSGRYLQSDRIGLAGGINTYTYVYNNPLRYIDPTGLAGIYVNYPSYPITVPGTDVQLPLGHAAVVAVDDNTGTTKYFEYGRYDSDYGQVKQRPVPDLQLDENGNPTQASLNNLYDYIGSHYGHDTSVDATYYPDANYQKIIDFALQRKNDPNRAPYSWNPLNSNTCKTFARDAINAGRQK